MKLWFDDYWIISTKPMLKFGNFACKSEGWFEIAKRAYKRAIWTTWTHESELMLWLGVLQRRNEGDAAGSSSGKGKCACTFMFEPLN